MKKLVFVLISILFICGCEINVKPVEEVTEDEIISFEYSLPDDHPFTYLDAEGLSEVLDKGTGIIVISNPDNEFSQHMINLFNDSLSEFDIAEVYYFDYVNLENLDSKIKEKLVIDESYLLSKPEFYLVKEGKIVSKYNLDAFDIDDIDLLSESEFKKDINDFYTNLICEIYTDKCDDKEN